MAKRDRLSELAEARGVSEEWYLDWVVVPMVNTLGQAGAARKLTVSQATVSRWLKDKYTPRVWWLKSATPEETRRIDALVERVKREREVTS